MKNDRAELLQFVLTSPWSDFYRTLYGTTVSPDTPFSEDVWSSLPLLERRHLTETPLTKRTFVDPGAVTTIRPSSGTSGGAVVMSARSGMHPINKQYRDAGITVTGYLAFVQPHHIIEMAFEQDGLLIPVIQGDLSDLRGTAALAAALPINAVRCYSYVISHLAPELIRAGLSEKIQSLMFLGERLSKAELMRIRALFPNATIFLNYGMSEAQGEIAVAVLSRDEEIPVHPVCTTLPGYFVELKTEHGITSTPKPGDEGELILTTLGSYAHASPALRYLSGDSVRIVSCEKPGVFSMIILGRTEGDRLKLLSGILWPEEVDRVLHEVLGERFDGDYELEVVPENLKERGIVYLNPAVLDTVPAGAADVIAENIRVSPERTYAQGVRDGLYGPLTLSSLPKEKRPGKRRRLYRRAESG